MQLRDKVALVSGGSGGLGQRIVRALHAQGCHVAATYLTNWNLHQKHSNPANKTP